MALCDSLTLHLHQCNLLLALELLFAFFVPHTDKDHMSKLQAVRAAPSKTEIRKAANSSGDYYALQIDRTCT